MKPQARQIAIDDRVPSHARPFFEERVSADAVASAAIAEAPRRVRKQLPSAMGAPAPMCNVQEDLARGREAWAQPLKHRRTSLPEPTSAEQRDYRANVLADRARARRQLGNDSAS